MSQRKHVVLLIHGIRTRAEWAQRIAAMLETEPGIRVKPVGYGFFDLIRFLLPFGFTRSGPITRVTQQVLDTLDRPEGRPDLSIIAHSFGTYIVAKILEGAPGIRLHRLIFCGAVVPADFRWEIFAHRLAPDASGEWHALNDCGMRDLWPVLAASVTWGYGASGRFGFQHVRVRDRFFDVGHSDYFREDFARHYWLPYLTEGRVVEGELERASTRWIVSVLTVFKLKYVFLALLFLLGAAAWALPTLFPYPQLQKSSGDGSTISSSSGGYGLFFVRVVARDGSPVAAARIAWHTPDCGSRAFVNTTDGTGAASATNLCNTLMPGSHEQVATLVGQNTRPGFHDSVGNIRSLSSSVAFTFEFNQRASIDSVAPQQFGTQGQARAAITAALHEGQVDRAITLLRQLDTANAREEECHRVFSFALSQAQVLDADGVSKECWTGNALADAQHRVALARAKMK